MTTGIKLGSCLFTLVEPQRGQERAYNEWYERDHFYSGMMAMPHCFAGRRWVATRSLKDLTSVADGSFLATYWIEAGRHEDFLRAAVTAMRELSAEGRMFDGRDHVHTGFYEIESWAQREAGGVAPELALDHPFPGLVAVLGGDAPPPRGAVAMRITLEPLATPGFGTGSEALHLLFADADPSGCVDDWRREGPGARWSRAFVPTTPGTDHLLDAL